MTVDPEEVHRYAGEEQWSPHARLAVERLREENAALQNELAERGPRPIRYAPDFSHVDGTHVFIQWKGTTVCLDFYCECGAQGHFDGDFAYSLHCGACGKDWEMPHSVALIPLPDSQRQWGGAKEVDMDDDGGASNPARREERFVSQFMSSEEYEEMEAEDAIERARDEQDERDEAWPPRDEPDSEVMHRIYDDGTYYRFVDGVVDRAASEEPW